MKIAINGFGRIGRQALKIALDKGLDVVAINDLSAADQQAHLLKYDTAHRIYDKEVKAHIAGEVFTAGTSSLLDIQVDEDTEQWLEVDGQKIRVFMQRDPLKLPWKELGVDVVLECTGAFVKDDKANAHIESGAKFVVLSAPSKGDSAAPTYVLGVNNNKINFDIDKIISNASCTTNCISPVAKVMVEEFGVEKAIMTTIHAYTSTQNLVDGNHKDLRRGRAAAQNIIPTTTGAAIATTEVLPELTGNFDGIAVRVPVINGSLTDFTFLLSKDATIEQVNQALEKASKTTHKGILAYSEAPLVSSDIIGRSESAIIDSQMTKVVGGNLVKVLAWYDNEWGYSNRLVEMAEELKIN